MLALQFLTILLVILKSTSATTMAFTDRIPLSQLDRIRGALYGLYYADAIAMPVHWMYDLRQLQADYGTITGYTKPKDKFVGSIMNLSNTGGGGRGSDKGDIVGNVILHGKKQYWVRGGNFHYHLGTLYPLSNTLLFHLKYHFFVGLQAGENTLEAQLTRLLTRDMTSKAGFDASSFRKAYIQFMQTPGSHRDTYASTCHRMFFANLVNGKKPEDCADNDGHNVDTIDALTLTIPVILKYASSEPNVRNNKVKECIRVTRRTAALDGYAIAFSDMLVDILHGKDLRQAVEDCGASFGSDDGLHRSIRVMVERSAGRGDPMTACYIDSAFPAMLFMAYKYAEDPEKALLANANAGGENVARGSLLGALMGAAYGNAGFPAWTREGLYSKEEIAQEIDAFAASI